MIDLPKEHFFRICGLAPDAGTRLRPKSETLEKALVKILEGVKGNHCKAPPHPMQELMKVLKFLGGGSLARWIFWLLHLWGSR